MPAQDALKKTVEAFNRHDADGFAALYATAAIAHDPQYPEPLRGRDAIRKDIEDFFRAFPDIQARVLTLLASGDTIAGEMEVSGTHKGPLVSPTGTIPATNRRMEMRTGRFVRVDAQDLITECNRYFDMAGLMQQLGLL